MEVEVVVESELELATATSHEATKSNCVATDCALVRRNGDRTVALMSAGRGGRAAGRRRFGTFACLSSTAAAVTWTVVRAARVVRKTAQNKTNETSETSETKQQQQQ